MFDVIEGMCMWGSTGYLVAGAVAIGWVAVLVVTIVARRRRRRGSEPR